MKSFRLARVEPPSAAPMPARELTPEARDAFRAAFRPVGERHRRVIRVMGSVIAVLFVGFVAGIMTGLIPAVFAGAGVFALMLLAGLMVLLLPSLACPNCHQELAGPLGQYCPECGNATLEPGRYLISPRCGACERTLRSPRGRRRYTIRACTHCGLWLDDQGV